MGWMDQTNLVSGCCGAFERDLHDVENGICGDCGERTTFVGEDEYTDMELNRLLSSSREVPSPLAFKVGDALAKIGVAIIVSMFIWTCILFDDQDFMDKASVQRYATMRGVR